MAGFKDLVRTQAGSDEFILLNGFAVFIDDTSTLRVYVYGK
jgi:hypothetical protein